MEAISKLTQYNGEKLQSGPAKDLRDYLKLLEDMKAAQEKIKRETDDMKAKRDKSLTDAQLEELLGTKTGAALPHPSSPLDPYGPVIKEMGKQLAEEGATTPPVLRNLTDQELAETARKVMEANKDLFQDLGKPKP